MDFLLVIAPYLLKKQHKFWHNLRSKFFQLEHRLRGSDKQLGSAIFNIWSVACFTDNHADSVFVDPVVTRPRFLDHHFIPTKGRARSSLHEPNWPMTLILVTCQVREHRSPCNCEGHFSPIEILSLLVLHTAKFHIFKYGTLITWTWIKGNNNNIILLVN